MSLTIQRKRTEVHRERHSPDLPHGGELALAGRLKASLARHALHLARKSLAARDDMRQAVCEHLEVDYYQSEKRSQRLRRPFFLKALQSGPYASSRPANP